MSSLKRLSKIFQEAKRIPIDDTSRVILISDCHRGDGSQADDFFRNENLYRSAMNYYYNNGYTYIELGDGDELWENKKFADIVGQHFDVFQLLRKFYLEGRLYFIYGNHDMVKRSEKYVQSNMDEYYDKREGSSVPLFENVKLHEGLVLEYQSEEQQLVKNEILLVHGHQVDDLNSSFWRLSRFLVRYFWKPLELFGVTDPTSPAQNLEKKEKVGKRLTEWVIRQNHMLVAGHNHRPMFPQIGEPLYFNDGSCVHPLFITGIEIDQGEISLIKWSVKVREDDSLYVGKDIVAGPTKLKEFFSAERIFSACTFEEPA